MKTDSIFADYESIYLTILFEYPLFSVFSTDELRRLIRQGNEQFHQKNEVVVEESQLIDAVYFIVNGRCEVSKLAAEHKQRPVATLGPGETIGLSSVGLFSETGTRTATVTALSSLHLLSFSTDVLHQFFKSQPHLPEQLAALERMRFIKLVAPFSSIPNEKVQNIATNVVEQTLPRDTTIFKQGDASDTCYIILAGRVEVVIENDQKVLAVLEEGSIFGETALMLGSRRSATVRTLEQTKLLKIDQALFNEITVQSDDVKRALMELQLRRCRPIQVSGIDVYTQTKADGSEVTILRNPVQGTYMQLSAQGLFLWNLLDGESSIKDIAIQFYLEFQDFNIEAIAEHITSLQRAGFVQLDIPQKILSDEHSIPAWMKIISKIRDVMEYRVTFGHADAWITTIYNRVGWFFFTRPALILWALIATFGFAAFVMHFETAIHSLAIAPHKWTLFYLQAFLVLLTVPLHELAHALTTKYFGRRVHSFGVGWMWFGPFAFCDTSDMWLGSKKEQVMVDLAGVYLNAILAGLAGLCVYFISPNQTEIIILLELFALNSYLFALANLDTALEFDGYYALMDILGKPNLRSSSMKWLAAIFSKEKTDVDLSIRHNYKEATYVFSALFFVFVIGAIVPYFVFAYLLEGLFGGTNRAINVAMAVVMVVISSIGLYVDFRKHSRRSD